jgi:NADH-ubiquinone oxidoreductase chain 1
VLLLSGNLNLTGNVEAQKAVFFLVPLLPVFIIFFIGAIAETNRAPFDLAEAESELVSGFMTEHSAAIFVFFFLAEYASIVLICIFTSILFLGGYLDIVSLDLIKTQIVTNSYVEENTDILIVITQGLYTSINLGLKACLMIFVFIWVRASFPRIRFDQLMSYCWTVLLPIVIAFIVILPCVVLTLHLVSVNFFVL